VSEPIDEEPIPVPEGFDVARENPEELGIVPPEISRERRRSILGWLILPAFFVALFGGMHFLSPVVQAGRGRVTSPGVLQPVPPVLKALERLWFGPSTQIEFICLFMAAVSLLAIVLDAWLFGSLRAGRSPTSSIRAFYRGVLTTEASIGGKYRPWFCLTRWARSDFEGPEDLLNRWVPYSFKVSTLRKEGKKEEEIVYSGFLFRGAREVVRRGNLARVESRLEKAKGSGPGTWLDVRTVVHLAGRWYLLDGGPHFPHGWDAQ
jgi:hypothetical protein